MVALGVLIGTLIPFVLFQVGYYIYLQVRDREVRATETIMALAETVIWGFQLNLLFKLHAANDPLLNLFFLLDVSAFWIYFGLAAGGTLILHCGGLWSRAQAYTTRCREKVTAHSYSMARDLKRKIMHFLFFVGYISHSESP